MKQILFPFLLLSLTLYSMTNKVKNPSNPLVKGSSIGHYAKSGALVDITYTTTPIEKDEVSEVNIILTSNEKRGKMSVTLTLDKNLEEIGSILKEYDFLMDASHQEYHLNFSLLGKKEGLFYVRLFVELNSKMRAFAVPIYVGDFNQLKSTQKSLRKGNNGMNISVSHAIETVH